MVVIRLYILRWCFDLIVWILETEAVSEDELPDGGAATDSTGKEEKSGDETKKSEGGKRKLQEGEYDPSSPTSENSQDDMPPSKKAAISDSKSSTPKPVVCFLFDFDNLKCWLGKLIVFFFFFFSGQESITGVRKILEDCQRWSSRLYRMDVPFAVRWSGGKNQQQVFLKKKNAD